MDDSRERLFKQNAVMYKAHLPSQLLRRFYVIHLIKKQSIVVNLEDRESLHFRLKIVNREDFFPLVTLTIKHVYPEQEGHFLHTRINKYFFHKKNLISGDFTNEHGVKETFHNPSGYLFEENAMLANQTNAHLKIIFKDIDKVIEQLPEKERRSKQDIACECIIF